MQEVVSVHFGGKAVVEKMPANQKDEGEHAHTNSLPHANPHVLESRIHLSPQKIVRES
jgi:hypothetical protein